MSVEHRRCDRCWFFDGTKSTDAELHGECRRNPPVVTSEILDAIAQIVVGGTTAHEFMPFAEWPLVRREYWCGDFRFEVR